MIRDVGMLAASGAAVYAWLSVVVAPLAGAFQSAVRRASRRSFLALALALGGAVLWTLAPAGAGLLLMMCEPRLGLAFLGSRAPIDGAAIGAITWALHALWRREWPHVSEDVEIGTALAVVALVRDDAATLSRVEALYREMAVAPARRRSPSKAGAARIAA